MSKKTFVREIEPYIELHKCNRTGIAWVENGKAGCGHSAHPNIDSTGSVSGMKKLGYWAEDAQTVKTNGAIYNIDRLVVTDKYDQIAADHCDCGSSVHK